MVDEFHPPNQRASKHPNKHARNSSCKTTISSTPTIPHDFKRNCSRSSIDTMRLLQWIDASNIYILSELWSKKKRARIISLKPAQRRIAETSQHSNNVYQCTIDYCHCPYNEKREHYFLCSGTRHV
jgi:hypothetical protein